MYNTVLANVGGDLNIESLQDTSKFDSKQNSGGLESLYSTVLLRCQHSQRQHCAFQSQWRLCKHQAGHVFNVVNQNGVVRFLDGQTGAPATLDGYTSFHLLKTN